MFKQHKGLFVIILFFLLIKFKQLFFFHPVVWDEAVYIGMGKAIYSLGSIGLWEDIRPIGLPLITGLFWKLGLNYIFLSELTIILFSAANLVLVYCLALKFFGRSQAIIATFFIAITPVYFFHSSKILTGVPSLFFVLLALFTFSNNKILISGVLTGIAVLFRFPNILLLLVFLSVLIFHQKSLKNSFKFFLGFLLPLTPYFSLNFYIYSSFLYPFLRAVPHQNNVVHAVSGNNVFLSNLFYYFIELFVQNPLLSFSIIALIVNFKLKQKNNLLFYYFFFYLTYFTLIINKQVRFSIIFLPAFALFAAEGFIKSYKFIRYRTFFLIICALLLIIPLNINLERLNYRPPVEVEPFSQFHKFFSDKPGVSVLTSNPVLVAFSDVKVFQFYEDIKTAEKLYDSQKELADYVVFTEDFWPCQDKRCENTKKSIIDKIILENNLIFQKKYKDYNYYIFKRTS